ncbi:hypothetical protein P256_01204 [Acinetobacter nectaris CIP 110549]|uniref:DUF2059 domain-containing protein n=1 Tax=Acinetobacter nectaris CIP 110549 TaxID=1392540 RepID=V2UZM5_9GAMM|nr:DUF2059 domain-containing protein [Acinetobacter nectaris]ESK40749.1 hypothetical protein P256_01204 [Acinetobacter nectaris CIP 110549]
MMKFIKPLALGILASQMISIAFASPAQVTTAQKIVDLTHLESDFNNNLKDLQSMYLNQAVTLVKQHTGHQTLTAQDNQAIERIIQVYNKNTTTISKSLDIKKIGTDIYLKNYSEEELKAYQKFLETPEGASIVQKIPMFSVVFNQEVAKYTQAINVQNSISQKTNTEVGQILATLPK